MLSFTEALHEEVAGTNLHVTCLCPGPTGTGFVAAAHMEGVNLFKMGAETPEAVARVGYAAFQNNKAVAISGFKNKLTAFSTRLAPRAAAQKLRKR